MPLSFEDANMNFQKEQSESFNIYIFALFVTF